MARLVSIQFIVLGFLSVIVVSFQIVITEVPLCKGWTIYLLLKGLTVYHVGESLLERQKIANMLQEKISYNSLKNSEALTPSQP